MPMENFVNEFNMWMQTVQSELQEKSMRSTIIICAATLDAQLEKLIKNILLQGNYSAPRLGYINFWSKQRKYNFCFIIALLRKVDNFSM